MQLQRAVLVWLIAVAGLAAVAACAGGGSSNSTGSTGGSSTPTPATARSPVSVSTGTMVNFTFTGSINGSTTQVVSTTQCGTGGSSFDFNVIVAVAGANYQVQFGTTNYGGGGTFTVGGTGASGIELTLINKSGSGVWSGSSGTITVAAGGKSGSVDASAQGSGAAALKGTFAC